MPNDPQPLLASAYWDYSRKAVVSQAVQAPFALTEQEQQQTATVQQCFQLVPWLFRSVEMRANAVAKMPFRIVHKGNKGNKDAFDDSNDYQNSLGFLPNPVDLLWRIEAAATIWGAAYLWRSYNRVKVLDLRYLLPTTIQPEIDQTGLTGFTRWVNGEPRPASTKDIIYLWRPDPFIEVGPPGSSPARAALTAAGVLLSVDTFAAAFFERGAIKATLLTVEGNPPKAEREALKTWWERVLGGLRNAFATEVVSANVKPVQIGEGIGDLANTSLTDEKKAEVAVALGIPQSVIFSASAGGLGGGGVAEQDDRHFYDKTILPECEWLQAALNDQVFYPLGFCWEFLPQSLQLYQRNEATAAEAFNIYVAAGLSASLAAELLGLDLPPGYSYGDLDRLRRLKIGDRNP